MKTKKGQITLVDIFVFFILILVASQLLPFIGDAIAPVIAYFTANPSSTSGLNIVLLSLVGTTLIVSIILSIINKAMPPRESYR